MTADPTMVAQAERARRSRRRLLGLGLLGSLVAVAAFVITILVLRRPAAPPAPAAVRYPTLVTTLAGCGAPGLMEGQGIGAAFDDPFGVAVDSAGRTWVSDGGDNNVIWGIDSKGLAWVVAGGREGFADGQARSAEFNTPSGIAIERSGNIVVADTGNHAIRRVTPSGTVTTLAGNGEAGMVDGAARDARFNGPVGVALAPDGSVVVADTYNDRIRRLGTDGQVTTIAGGSGPGYRDGAGPDALFDTPGGVAVDETGTIYVADTGNDLVRRIATDGQVTTLGVGPSVMGGFLQQAQLLHPVGIAVGNLNGKRFVFVTDAAGRVVMLSPAGEQTVLTGQHAASERAASEWQRMRTPTGIAVAADGSLRVADTDNYVVRRLTREDRPVRLGDVSLTPRPRLTAGTLKIDTLLWPVDPQRRWHEVAATVGEARGSAGGDGRERLHAGIDVHAPTGTVVRSVRDEKVGRVLAATGFGGLNEALHVGVVSYVHVRVGRTAAGRPVDAVRLPIVNDETGRPARVRVRRGTRFHTGDPLGSVNKFAHVHFGIGPSGGEINVLALPLADFHDRVPPAISSVEIYAETGQLLGNDRIAQRARKPVPVFGRATIVVEAFDRVDGNAPKRKLGVYSLGYQVLGEDGTPVRGFETTKTTIVFDRLPADPAAPALVYAEGSGIPAYGSKITRFRYIITDHLEAGTAWPDAWDTTTLAPGRYRLRVVVSDFSGNATTKDIQVEVPVTQG